MITAQQPTRLIILLDGTWQTDSGYRPPSNVVRLRDLILPKNLNGQPEFTQHIYYDSGVGSGGAITKRSFEGATGSGLEDIVRGAYRQVCHRYQPGMEIYVFGFSRGAFSARSLVGYINASGLLKEEHCSAVQEKKAWEFYRKPRRYRIPAEKKALQDLCWPETPRIKCLGVFDTVGARGIPGSLLRYRNIERYGFHDTTLSSIVDYAFHALALEEQRRTYGPTIWSYDFHHNNEGIEQVWFPGCHADVGGGVDGTGLSNIPLYWMISRIRDRKLGLELDQEGIEKIRNERDPLAGIKGNKSLIYKVLSLVPSQRKVSQTSNGFGDHLLVGLPRHLKPLREAVHWSVFARMAAKDFKYDPPNLNHAEFWESVYKDKTPTDTDIVGKNECFLEWWKNPADHEEMCQILPEAQVEAFTRHAKSQLDHP